MTSMCETIMDTIKNRARTKPIGIPKAQKETRILIRAQVMFEGIKTTRKMTYRLKTFYHDGLTIKEWTNKDVLDQINNFLSTKFGVQIVYDNLRETPTKEPTRLINGYEIWTNTQSTEVEIITQTNHDTSVGVTSNTLPKTVMIGDMRKISGRCATIGKGLTITGNKPDEEYNMKITVHDLDHMILNIEYNTWTNHNGPYRDDKQKIIMPTIETMPTVFTVFTKIPSDQVDIRFEQITNSAFNPDTNHVINYTINNNIAGDLTMKLKDEKYIFEPYNQHERINLHTHLLTTAVLPVCGQLYGLTLKCTHSYAIQFCIAQTFAHVVRVAFIHKIMDQSTKWKEYKLSDWEKHKEILCLLFPLNSWCDINETVVHSRTYKDLFYEKTYDRLYFDSFESVISRTINQRLNMNFPTTAREWRTVSPEMLVTVINQLIKTLYRLHDQNRAENIVNNTLKAIHKATHTKEPGGQYTKKDHLKEIIIKKMQSDELSFDPVKNSFKAVPTYNILQSTTNLTVGQIPGLTHTPEQCQKVRMAVNMADIDTELKHMLCLYATRATKQKTPDEKPIEPDHLYFNIPLGNRQMCISATAPMNMLRPTGFKPKTKRAPPLRNAKRG